MTRARALKKVIRARIAKTGERYTTARRQVLKQLPDQASLKTRLYDQTGQASLKSRLNDDTAAPRATTTTTKGGMSDATSIKKTGHDLAHWFAVLDTFDAVGKGHTAAARHLSETHGVDGWYAQGITVAFERARGVRAVNQRCDGVYEVSVSKVIAASNAEIIKAFTDPKARKHWLNGADAEVVRSLTAAVSGRTAKKFAVSPNGAAYLRFKLSDSTVVIQLWPRPKDKVAVTATNAKLSNSAMVEEQRAKWKVALGGLATYLHA
jgi:hypothetical protein